jgi:hypothetical protein
MADFIHADLGGSRFERVDLSGAQLRAIDLSSAMFRGGAPSAALTSAIWPRWRVDGCKGQTAGPGSDLPSIGRSQPVTSAAAATSARAAEYGCLLL